MSSQQSQPEFTPAEAELICQARALARQRVAPLAPGWERERRIGREVLEEAAALGLMRLQVPTSHGGLDASFACKVAVCEALAGGDFGFTMSWVNTHNVAAKLARDASPTLAGRYLPELLATRRLGCTALTEPGAGSDFAAITTRAERTAGGWRLNGAKAWITNAAEADVVVLYAQTAPGSGGRGIAGFLVDARRSGFEREPAYALGGQHSIGTGGFRLVDYLADDAELLHPPGQAFKAALGSINGARTYIAAMCCGMVDAALAVAADHGQRRHAFGLPLAGHQGWRWRLAEAASALQAARLMVGRAVAAVQHGAASADAQLAAAQAKLVATRMAEQQIGVLAHAMGAEGLREAHPFARHAAGVQVAGFVDGSTEMLLERIAAVMAARP
jgi:alkylation response protein AidB-like acyl-CoA dehydrogenase